MCYNFFSLITQNKSLFSHASVYARTLIRVYNGTRLYLRVFHVIVFKLPAI